jgi:hypothetical protein
MRPILQKMWQAWTGSPSSMLTATWSVFRPSPISPTPLSSVLVYGTSLEQSVGGVDRVILNPEVRINTGEFVFCSASLAEVVHLLTFDV